MDPSHLFVATPNGFYFDAATKVVENWGKIHPLSTKEISEELQAQYLEQLNYFVQKNGE